MPVVWSIRHGESQANVGELTCSSQTTELTTLGRAQGREIVTAFKIHAPSPDPSRIIISKYTRSQQTATPTIEIYPHAPREEWPVHEFTYLTEKENAWTTRQQRCQSVQRFWANNDPDYSEGKGAESFAQFITRVYYILEHLRYHRDDFLAIFTHGQFIQAMLWLLQTQPEHLDDTSKQAFRRFCREHPIPSGSIQEFVFHGRDQVHCGKLMTDHLSAINSYEPCCAENTVGS